MASAFSLGRPVAGALVLLSLAAFAPGARAQSRHPVMPGFQESKEQATPAAAAPAPAPQADPVGQTPAQQARATADEEARLKLEAELKAKAEAVDRARAESDARAAAAGKAAGIAAEKREAARAAAQRKAQAREEAKCRKTANTQAAKKCKAMVAQKFAPREMPLPQVAAAPAPLHPADGGAVALPLEPLVPEQTASRRVIAPAGSSLQPAPAPAPTAFVAAPPAAAPAAPAPQPAPEASRPLVRPDQRTDTFRPAVSTTGPSAAPASLRPPSSPSSGGLASSGRTLSPAQTLTPRDEGGSRSRQVEVTDAAQVGPSSLILNKLVARGEVVPESVQANFGYRFAIDEDGVAHHLFAVGLESGRCEQGSGCGALWFLNAGYSPQGDGTFDLTRTIHQKPTATRDELAWSATTAAAGLGYSGRTWSFLADAQLEALSVQYLKNLTTSPARSAASLDQLRIRGTLSATGRGFTASFRVAGYAYPAGDAPSAARGVPLRGALIDDDLGGLAIAPQGFLARVEGRYESAFGFGAALSYGYLGYAGPDWASAHLVNFSLSQRLGRLRLSAGIALQEEVPTLMPANASASDYGTLFGTGSIGVVF